MPLVPQWLRDITIERYFAYPSQYESLAARLAGNDTFYEGANITLAQINAYAATATNPDEPGLFLGPFLSIATEMGSTWGIYYMSSDDPPPTVFQYDYWNAMCTGLATWQMYAVFIGEQIVRFGQFGHYGRKPKD